MPASVRAPLQKRSPKSWKVSLLLAAAALALGLHGGAAPQDLLRFNWDLFADNRQVLVHGPTLAIRRDLTAGTALSIKGQLDAVSSASISCSLCHKNRQGWTRNEVSVGARHRFGAADLGLSYFNSRERDYDSDALTLSASKNLNQDNTTLSLDYTYSWDRAHPHGWNEWLRAKGKRGYHFDFDLGPDRDLPLEPPTTHVQALALGWTQVLHPRALVQLTYEFTAMDGYQSDAYHLLPVDGVDLFERHPDKRRRHALASRFKYALSTASSLGLDYRYYTDDWAISSHTAGLEYYRYLRRDAQLLRLRWRLYDQTAASFYQPEYDGTQALRTNDDRLQAYGTQLYGISLSWLELGLSGPLAFMAPLRLDTGYTYYTGGPDLRGVLSSGRIIKGSSSGLDAHLFRLGLGRDF